MNPITQFFQSIQKWLAARRHERESRRAKEWEEYQRRLAREKADHEYWQWHDHLYPGGSPNSPEWRQLERRIYGRDHYRCVRCGREGRFPKRRPGQPFVATGPYVGLHVHHIQPLSKGGSNDSSNLQTLCKQCHEQAHGRSLQGKYN
jgi:5-methylcytosine-specific restriction endonuclease McrA